MTSLRQQLERLSGPVEVDSLMGLVHRLEATIEAESTGLSNRCRRIVAELNEAVVGVDEAIAVMNDVAGQSGHGAGLMATMRSTFAGARVDEVRQRALRGVVGAVGVVSGRLQRAFVAIEYVSELRGELEAASRLLEGLGRRALNGGLETESGKIADLAMMVQREMDALKHLSSPLASPIQNGFKAVERGQLAAREFATTKKAGSVGQQSLDWVFPALNDTARGLLQETLDDALPSWLEQSTQVSSADVTAVEAGGVSRRELDAIRREEALRRAAEAELDALE